MRRMPRSLIAFCSNSTTRPWIAKHTIWACCKLCDRHFVVANMRVCCLVFTQHGEQINFLRPFVNWRIIKFLLQLDPEKQSMKRWRRALRKTVLSYFLTSQLGQAYFFISSHYLTRLHTNAYQECNNYCSPTPSNSYVQSGRAATFFTL